MKPTGIILLEGADASGKTTLAAVLREKYSARYIHGGLYKDPWLWHCAAIRRALRLAIDNLVVIDRNFISHLVYGHIFGNQQYAEGAYHLDALLLWSGCVTVLCVPSDPLRQEVDWRSRREAGKIEHFDRVREVIALYMDLARGNVAQPGEGWLFENIRYGDYADREDVMIYDRYAYAGKPKAFARRLVAKLESHKSVASVADLIDEIEYIYRKYR